MKKNKVPYQFINELSTKNKRIKLNSIALHNKHIIADIFQSIRNILNSI